MTASNPKEADRTFEPSPFVKEVERMEDGRKIIYYSFRTGSAEGKAASAEAEQADRLKRRSDGDV